MRHLEKCPPRKLCLKWREKCHWLRLFLVFLHLLITAFITTNVMSCFTSNSSLSHFSFKCSTLCTMHLLNIGIKLWRVEGLKEEFSNFLSCFHLSAEIYIAFMNKENLCGIQILSKCHSCKKL